ncbi:uncharacterized protein BX664DRAFT_275281 [Halteromyces radiatus]|uniref:uncharacterized protein n=1 Tax=Halteromyces radiatus TaxID=101107 RepID=UPI00221FB952|nr:uncharacterized protein BX664DRAFT_275281 [Halteromyces radiatus]KAI8096897.1 hypothetical protein BX664DRAFT_275281 [Halteromyces radiatus]
MFLDWIAQLQLLQHDSQTDILESLPLPIRRILISEITSFLIPSNTKYSADPSIFSSPAHVKWYMEVIGQGFALPLEDMNITNDSITIYSQWLLEPNLRPAAVVTQDLDQEFFQIIFHQYSLLFQPRIFRSSNQQQQQQQQQHSTSNTIKDTLAPLVQRHIDLCNRILTVISTAGRTLDLSSDTWTVLLKVMLGITDSLLKEPSGETPIPGVKNISDELCEPLLRVLFELWLRSRTKEIDMWNILKSCFTRWCHRPQVIQYWSLVSLSLTHRVIHFLFGQDEGTDSVYLFSGKDSTKLDLMHDEVKYAWHRIIYLLPPPVQLSPPNFILAMKGIGQLVDALNTVGLRSSTASTSTSLTTNSNYNKNGLGNQYLNTTATINENAVDAIWTDNEPPDGNTILNMFGSMLFDACALASEIEDYERQCGCAEAIGTLCKVFCRPQRRNEFQRTYLERFYAALSLGLKSDICLPTILLSGTELFATDLKGIRMLVPDFIAATKMVVPKLKIDVRSHISTEVLRLAALKIIGTVMCLPNHYENVTLKAGWEWDMQCSSDTTSPMTEQDQMLSKLIRVLYEEDSNTQVERPYTNLKFYILELLLLAFRTESSSYNMRFILHLINVYVVEDVPFCPGLVGTVVKLIQDKILTMQLPSDVTLVAFDVLMDFVDLYDYVKRDSKNIARELVLALSRYLDTLINARKLVQSYPLIVQAYNCMIKWVLASQWIMDDRDCYQAVITTLSKGITIFERTTDVTPPSTEKKKRRDTTFPPTKQLFQLQPKSNRITASSSSSNNNNNNDTRATHTHRQGYRKEEMAVRMAAEYCMSQFVNQLGRSSFRSNSTHDNQWMTLKDDLRQLRYRHMNRTTTTTTNDLPDLVADRNFEDIDNIRYFLLENKMILAIIEATNFNNDQQFIEDAQSPSPSAANDSAHVTTKTPLMVHPRNIPSLIAIIRDTTGKYIWTMETRYKDHQQQSPSSQSSRQGTQQSTLSVPSSPSSPKFQSDSTTQTGSILPTTTLTTSPPTVVTPTEKMDYFNVTSHHKDPLSGTSPLPGTTTPTAVAVNNDDIPHLDSIFEKNTDNWKQWRSVKKLAEKQEQAEQLSLQNNPDKPLHYYKCSPTTSNIDLEYSKAFRLILSEFGYLLPQNRYRITPLRPTDVLLSELETLDSLNARECISITIYYANSGDSTWSDIVTEPPKLSEPFMQFLNCIGWPVELKHHTGFKGKLDSSICQTTPYYSDRTVEFIANVPYFLSLPTTTTTLSSTEQNGNITYNSDMADWTNEKDLTIDKIHESVTSEDRVCVIWIKHLVNYTSLAQRIKSSSHSSKIMVYLFIHPLSNTADGLYWIRILVPPFGNTPASIVASQRLHENALIFGPLVDKMVISRHALGAMVRNTAISAHQACRVVTDTYTRPYVVRKQFIEEMSIRNRTKLSLSEFYTEIFSEKDD